MFFFMCACVCFFLMPALFKQKTERQVKVPSFQGKKNKANEVLEVDDAQTGTRVPWIEETSHSPVVETLPLKKHRLTKCLGKHVG